MKYVVLSPEGFPSGFYDAAVHSTIPQGAVQITDAQWLEFLQNQGRRKWENGQVVEYDPPPVQEPVPSQISFRQCVIGMLMGEIITPQEADDWSARAALPQFVSATIDTLPEEQRLFARITARTMTEVERSNPLIEAAAAIKMPNATPEERSEAADNYFRAWKAI